MPVVAMLSIFTIVPTVQATPLTCNMVTQTGDDDGSFPMTLPFSLSLGSQEYNQVYYSTNGLMSFGSPDGNFWDYPTTPSVTLAGRDWVSWGAGAYTSYGYNESSFCIEWSVRPFPQSSGDLTQIRLVVNRFPNGGWHGEITTLGWIPDNIRRGIRYDPNEPVVPISAAFDVNGGVPVEVSPAPAPTSLTEPPAIPVQCWDGSTVYAPNICSEEPSFTCWDGTTTHYSSECSTEPVVICWDSSQVHYQSECSPTPPDIICWDGEIIAWNGVCRQVPPPIECWDGSSVNWNEQCTPIPPDTICWDNSTVAWNELCPVEPTPEPSPEPTEVSSPEPSPVPSLTDQPSPEPSETLPEPTQQPTTEPSESSTPTPTPSITQSVDPEPHVTPSLAPEPVPSFPSEEPAPVVFPSVVPSTDPSSFPSDNIITEPFVVLENGVVLQADVAEALQIFDSPSELVKAIFTDPGKALKAFLNVGADMTPAQRDESQKVIIAAVIAGQLMNALSAANMVGRKL